VTEPEFLDLLRTLPLHAGALGLTDDAARIAGAFVVTTDTLVEGVHFLPDDPAGDVAWKLLAVNLSDLAGKGARPVAVLLNYSLSDDAWDRGFIAGLDEAMRELDVALLGGDTVSLPPGARRVLTLTAFGQTDNPAGARSGARAGDALWVCGTIGDAGAGLRIARGATGPTELLAAYRRPRPLIAEGVALAPHVAAMMDVSDGLLIDAARLARASQVAASVDLDAVPLSDALRRFDPDPLAAATAGDDYALLFALPPGVQPPVAAARIGTLTAGSGLTITRNGAPDPLPDRLGWLHGASPP
jgi:thiamine-monophosphate kinase